MTAKTPKKILLVNPSTLNLLFESIVLAGRTEHEMLTATNGNEAIRKALLYSPDMIVMEMDMKELGGIETCKEIRWALTPRQTYVVLVTNCDPAEWPEIIRQSGCNQCIASPVSAAVLVSLVQSSLQQLEQPETKLVQKDDGSDPETCSDSPGANICHE